MSKREDVLRYLVCVYKILSVRDMGYRSSIRRSLEMKIAFVHVVVVQRCDIVIARDEIENTVSRVKDFKNLKRVLIFYNSILFKSQTCTVH